MHFSINLSASNSSVCVCVYNEKKKPKKNVTNVMYIFDTKWHSDPSLGYQQLKGVVPQTMHKYSVNNIADVSHSIEGTLGGQGSSVE